MKQKEAKTGPPTVGQMGSDERDQEEKSSMSECVDVLRGKLQEAQVELDELNQRLSMKGDYGLGVGDPRIYEWEMTLARREKVERRIRAIEGALERANSGTYGICERCGRRIQVERLAALPFTTLCIECAREMG